MTRPQIGIVMGSDSDLPVMRQAAKILEQLGVEYEVVISSAHRVPEKTAQYAATAEERGLEVIIAAAGGAAHLPGVIAAKTVLPVIGVPIKTSTLGGVDSLYSVVQMPRGIPVATVAINGAKNAGILAAQIIGVKDAAVREKIKQFKQEMAREVEEKDKKLQELGVTAYLQEMKK